MIGGIFGQIVVERDVLEGEFGDVGKRLLQLWKYVLEASCSWKIVQAVMALVYMCYHE